MKRLTTAIAGILICGFGLTGCTPSVQQQNIDWDATLKLGMEECSQRKYAKACKHFREAIDIAEKADKNDLRIATVASYFAAMQAGRGQLADAELLYKNAIDIEVVKLGAGSAEVNELRKALAEVLKKETKTKEADQVMELVKQSSKLGKGPSSTTAAKADTNRAWPSLSAADKAELNRAATTTPTGKPPNPLIGTDNN